MKQKRMRVYLNKTQNMIFRRDRGMYSSGMSGGADTARRLWSSL